MDPARFTRIDETAWRIEPVAGMRVPAIIFGRAMSRHAALKRWSSRKIVDDLALEGILIRSPSSRGVAEEAPGAYKDVGAVCEAAERAGLARRVARVRPVICIKG
jgi:tRNA-splicing ligase RtcB